MECCVQYARKFQILLSVCLSSLICYHVLGNTRFWNNWLWTSRWVLFVRRIAGLGIMKSMAFFSLLDQCTKFWLTWRNKGRIGLKREQLLLTADWWRKSGSRYVGLMFHLKFIFLPSDWFVTLYQLKVWRRIITWRRTPLVFCVEQMTTPGIMLYLIAQCLGVFERWLMKI